MLQRITGGEIRRRHILSFFLLLIALFTLWQVNANLDGSITTTLTLESGAPDAAASIAIPTQLFLNVTGAIMLAAAVVGIAVPERFERPANGFLIVAGILIFPTIFIAAVGDGRTNGITMITESLRLATPIAIGAMAGLWCERSGVVNIAIEGMMLFAACTGFTTLFLLRDAFPPEQINLLLGLSVGIAVLTGGLAALLHAWLSITFATDQIVSGTVINIMALGVTGFIRREVLLSSEAGLTTLPVIEIPVLSDIPIIGEALFANKPIFFMMFVVVIVSHIVLFHTRWGLRTRAVGENPHAADTLGIKVNRNRWINVFIGGLIAGLAGAWFSLEATGRFTDGMTNGSGFISLAALIFGKFTPVGAFGGALLFGFSDALGTRFQIIDVQVPPQFLQMVPYIVTIIVLAGLVGRAVAPKADGIPYKKE
jgi:simple sugar transport system permease protein